MKYIIIGVAISVLFCILKLTVTPYISWVSVVWPSIAFGVTYLAIRLKKPLIDRSKCEQDIRVLDELIQPARMTGVKYFGDLSTVCIFYETINGSTALCKALKNGETWLYVRMADTGRWEKWRRATTHEIDGAYESALSNLKQMELLNKHIKDL
jgi:hypothetical protein